MPSPATPSAHAVGPHTTSPRTTTARPTAAHAATALPGPIRDEGDVRRGLDWLATADPRLAAVRERVERVRRVPLRLDRPGFAPLVEIVCAQQISRASADAIHARLRALVDPLTPGGVLRMSEADARAAGLSRPKERTLREVARWVAAGRLDLDGVCRLPAGEAVAAITAVPGLGPWTAGVYLLFCGGHPDILPDGDVALQWSAADALGRADKLSARELAREAEAWSPWRGVASRLLWANYAVLKGREVIP